MTEATMLTQYHPQTNLIVLPIRLILQPPKLPRQLPLTLTRPQMRIILITIRVRSKISLVVPKATTLVVPKTTKVQKVTLHTMTHLVKVVT